MSAYSGLAPYYDALMEFDYDRLVEYYRELFEHYEVRPATILDACCGTGQVTYRLAEYGYDMTGVDNSTEMLSLALNSCAEHNVLLLCQDLCELDLNDTVDAVVCALDGINHLESLKTLQEAFKKLALFCNDDGLLIFDVHSKRHFYETLGDNTFVFDEKDVYCVWQTQVFGKCLQHTLDFFIPCERRKYTRSFDDFNEYYYERDELAHALDAAGFDLVDVLGDMTFEAADENKHERLFYIAKRRKRVND
ncbi:MAG: class I SAM-dependent methyltransferase [Clostridia bacterium]|nr:class I SAM-dependent methyltransferase [Clostridia bacterium]